MSWWGDCKNTKQKKNAWNWKQLMVSSILPKNEQKLSILSIFSTQDCEFRSFFGRIEETLRICFRDCLTFSENNLRCLLSICIYQSRNLFDPRMTENQWFFFDNMTRIWDLREKLAPQGGNNIRWACWAHHCTSENEFWYQMS